jgi:putative Holliday junction resolvase
VSFSWNEHSRFLGLDVGDRRIGVAVSDPTGSLARPVETYERRSVRADVQHIVDLAGEYDAIKVVVGLPKNMNGTEGPQAEKTRDFAAALAERGLSIDLWDERLSTVEASRRLIEQRRRGRRLQERLDSEAAAVILQTYLDHVRIKEGR